MTDAIIAILQKIDAQFGEVVEFTGKVVWGPQMLLLLVGTGLYLTFRLKFIQVLKFMFASRVIWGGVKRSDKSEKEKGDISPYQALTMSLAAAVGNGNIAGVATAIAVGGPGAVFWMWVTAVVGMATKFGEVVLGLHYRKTNPDGTILGGPMMYLKDAFPWKKGGVILAGFFAFAMGLKCLFSVSMVQSNSIALAFNTHFDIPMWVSGLALAGVTWIVIIGGVKKISRITEFLAPIMSLIYIAGGLVVIFLFYKELPAVVTRIFSEAFTGTAALGGFTGSTFMIAMRFGVARGSYSNEAGIGSAAVAHAAAKTNQPVRQGLIAMMDVFIDTMILCTITAFVILLTGEWLTGTTSTEMTTMAFDKSLPVVGGWIVVLSSFLFGYSSMISWPYMGEQGWAYLFGQGIRKYYRWVFCILIFFGSLTKVNTVWLLADTVNGLMALPNLIGVLALSGVIIKLTKEHFNNGKYIKGEVTSK